MLLVMVVTSVCMVSCGDDDDIPTDIATTIAGDYSGKLSVIGYTEQFTAYATLTRKSDNAISVVVDCDEIDLHLKSVILDIMQKVVVVRRKGRAAVAQKDIQKTVLKNKYGRDILEPYMILLYFPVAIAWSR